MPTLRSMPLWATISSKRSGSDKSCRCEPPHWQRWPGARLERSIWTAKLLHLRHEAAEDNDAADLQSAAEEAARLARQHYDHERLTQALTAGVCATTLSQHW
jgi:hypothetical protein